MSLVAGLLNQKVDYIKSTSVDGYGDVTTTTVYSDVPCRWVNKISVIAGKDAKLRQARAEIWLLPKYSISSDYEIIKGGETYKIVGVEEKYNLTGVHDHTKVYLV